MRRCENCRAVARGRFCSQCGSETTTTLVDATTPDELLGNSVSMNNSQNFGDGGGGVNGGVTSSSMMMNSNNNNIRSASGAVSDYWKQVDSAWKSRSGFGN